jgi:hypothetical protein
MQNNATTIHSFFPLVVEVQRFIQSKVVAIVLRRPIGFADLLGQLFQAGNSLFVLTRAEYTR